MINEKYFDKYSHGKKNKVKKTLNLLLKIFDHKTFKFNLNILTLIS